MAIRCRQVETASVAARRVDTSRDRVLLGYRCSARANGVTRRATSQHEEPSMADVDPFATATALLAALRARRVSARELTDLYIRRIQHHDGRLNAVVVRDFERARRQADAADQACTRG